VKFVITRVKQELTRARSCLEHRHFFVTLLLYFPTKRSIQGEAVDLGGRRSTLGCAAIFSREGVVKALIDPENEL
jgi:hypothetical protein